MLTCVTWPHLCKVGLKKGLLEILLHIGNACLCDVQRDANLAERLETLHDKQHPLCSAAA